MSSLWRGTTLGVSVLAIAAAAGCSRSELQDMSPPPSAYVEAPPAPPPPSIHEQAGPTELLGGPGPSPYEPSPGLHAQMPPQFGTMEPIPNPEDMDPVERAEVYGSTPGRTAEQRRVARAQPAPGALRSKRAERREAAAPGRAARAPDIARPSGPVSPGRPAPMAAPATPVVPASPAVTAQAPAPAANAGAPITAATPQTKAEQLGAALAPEVTSGSTLDIPSALATGQEGVVTLTLPNGLLERVRAEATALGLGLAARAVDIRARLTGPGYVIVPNETQTARLQENEPTSFSWQVTPGPGEKGPLTAEVEGQLSGAEKPLPLSLGAVGEGLIETATVPNAPLVTVPGVGPVRSGIVVLVGLALLALILLAAFGRKASERRRAAQRQRAREARADFSPGDKAAPAGAAAAQSKPEGRDTPAEPSEKDPQPS